VLWVVLGVQAGPRATRLTSGTGDVTGPAVLGVGLERGAGPIAAGFVALAGMAAGAAIGTRLLKVDTAGVRAAGFARSAGGDAGATTRVTDAAEAVADDTLTATADLIGIAAVAGTGRLVAGLAEVGVAIGDALALIVIA